jgi:hypothetical protein
LRDNLKSQPGPAGRGGTKAQPGGVGRPVETVGHKLEAHLGLLLLGVRWRPTPTRSRQTRGDSEARTRYSNLESVEIGRAPRTSRLARQGPGLGMQAVTGPDLRVGSLNMCKPGASVAESAVATDRDSAVGPQIGPAPSL